MSQQPADRQPNNPLPLVIAIMALVVLAVGLIIIIATANPPEPAGRVVTVAPELRLTLDPTISANLTALPQATPLSDEDATVWTNLRALVDACPAYDAERRRQMEQHIAWLIDPSAMPPDVIRAMGTNPTERLVFAMASYTSIQWRLADRPAESCLVPIGRLLNEMLVTLGSDPITIYDE